MLFWLVLGLALLLAGGELLVRGAVATARHLKISPLVIGVTLVGFGTSTPELVTSLEAAFRGSPGIAVGNVVGSNTANILLILGLSALIYPIACDPRALTRDATVAVIAALACLAVVVNGTIGTTTGFVFLAALAGYVAFSLVQDRRKAGPAAALHQQEADLVARVGTGLWLSIGLAVAGIAITILGARVLVDAAMALAQTFGFSETIIALTIVAVGTSLPELVSSVIAAFRRHGDVALGNVLGSNIYNVFGILGVTAAVHPLDIPTQILRLDIWVMLAATAAMMLFAVTGRRLSRGEGAALFCGYIVYTGFLAATAAG